ncbi:hypothetical protein [Herpetosiphon geysericola]|uniref:Carboxypeptidase regulatory-like domain-containing protein n=1 Tax=Herpetosiphon geysericola TaxID=70996 RepID=A0A0P6XB37_9CHLR|nr:hypothetical protein [Herpetosiphon geysericola]KPL79963.1 hypothetical protein SE18_25575 [Herpetosiphon geysericola]
MRRIGWFFLIILAMVMRLSSASMVAAQEAATVTVEVQMSDDATPLRGATISLIQGAITLEGTTDANGETVFAVAAQGYTLLVEGRTPDGFPLQLDAFYAARGGMPVFATAGVSTVTLIVDDVGIVMVAAPAVEIRETGSQRAVPLTEPPMAPIPPLNQADLSGVSSLPTLVYLTATAAPVRTVTPRAIQPVAAQPSANMSNPLIRWILILLGIGVGAGYWFVVRPQRLRTTSRHRPHTSEVK